MKGQDEMTNDKITRTVDYTAHPRLAAIRLARVRAQYDTACCWNYDWTPGPSYGSRRPATWAEKRAAVKFRYDQAKVDVAFAKERIAKRERAERLHGDKIERLHQAKRDLELKPWGVSIRAEREEMDRKIAAIIDAA